MKPRTLILAIGMSLILPEIATGAPTDEFCGKVGGWAETIMKTRQAGAPMSALLEGLENNRMRIIVQYAYEKPAFMTDEMQTISVRNFRNEVEMDCYKGNWE